MAFDGYTMRCLVIELKNSLVNGRIEKIYQPRKDTLLFHMRTLKGREKLLLSANPSNPRIYLTSEEQPNLPHPPMLCMLLRKHISGGTIVSINQHGMDRVMEFVIGATDQLGTRKQKRLICEIMGRHSNIILLEEDGKIIDSVKRVTAQMSSYRHIFPGMDYTPPPSQLKLDISVANYDDLENILLSRIGVKASKAIADTLEGMGKTLARELCVRSGIDPDRPLEKVTIPAVVHTACELACILERGDFHPIIYYRDGDVFDFSPIPLSHLALPYKKSPNINEMLDSFFFKKAESETLNRQRNNLLKIINSLIEKNQKKLSNRVQDSQTASGKDHYRLYGELLIANLHRLKEKTDHVKLEDYNRPGLPVVHIELDPEQTPLQNANRFFEEYNRSKRTLLNLRKLISQTKGEMDYLESIVYSIESCTELDELQEIKLELEKGGYLKPVKGDSKQKNISSSGPLSYRSRDGFTIYVGRNNRQNDYLTQRFAGKEDLWLHTKNIPGSHVLIKSEGRKVLDTTLYEGALLAAYHSKARQSGSVPVDYTLVKHVSKPKGAKPGYVVYKNQKTLFITPNREEIDEIEKLKGPPKRGL